MARKLFGTDGIRGKANTFPITPQMALQVGIATGIAFRNGKHRHRVVIGKDTRLSGYMIEPALTAGFTAAGMDVFLLGPMPTPAVAMLTRSMRADLGVMWRQELLPTELAFHTIGWIPLKLVCGKDHPLAKSAVDWEELKRHRQIMVAVRSEGPEKQRLRTAAEVWWVESHWVILQILRQGIGWALVPDHIVAHSPVAGDLATPALQFDVSDWPVALELVWHKQRPSGPAAKWLRERFAKVPIGGADG